MPIRILRLDHFAVYVTDLGRAERFYREYLGMEVHARIGTEQVLMRCGDTLLALFAKPGLKTPAEPGAVSDPLGRAHFAVTVSPGDWQSALSKFEEAGVPVSKPIDWGDHDCFYVTDPDGNLIELMSWRGRPS